MYLYLSLHECSSESHKRPLEVSTPFSFKIGATCAHVIILVSLRNHGEMELKHSITLIISPVSQL